MAAVDRVFQHVRTLFGTLRFFRRGWGRQHNPHSGWLSAVRSGTLRPHGIHEIQWEALRFPLSTLSLGTFTSPSASFLPPESRRARVLYVPASPYMMPTNPPPLVLLLPATGDHGFLRRFISTSVGLRARGIASLILEGPFYGSRRPAGQRGALLDYVHQLPDLGRATIEESLALLRHFRERGFTGQAVTGISQGGLHAAMAASLCDWCVPVVMGFAPHSAVPVFTEGVLSRAVDWNALGGDVQSGMVREQLRRVFAVTDINNFPVREGGGRHVLVFARSDR